MQFTCRELYLIFCTSYPSIPIDRTAPDRIPPLPTLISTVPFYSVYDSIPAVLHNANMIACPIAVPVKKYYHARLRGYAAAIPTFFRYEPTDAILAVRELWRFPLINIPALVSTPADKTGAPVYVLRKTVPTPVRPAALIANLRLCNLHNGSILRYNSAFFIAMQSHNRSEHDDNNKNQGEQPDGRQYPSISCRRHFYLQTMPFRRRCRWRFMKSSRTTFRSAECPVCSPLLKATLTPAPLNILIPHRTFTKEGFFALSWRSLW